MNNVTLSTSVTRDAKGEPQLVLHACAGGAKLYPIVVPASLSSLRLALSAMVSIDTVGNVATVTLNPLFQMAGSVVDIGGEQQVVFDPPAIAAIAAGTIAPPYAQLMRLVPEGTPVACIRCFNLVPNVEVLTVDLHEHPPAEDGTLELWVGARFDPNDPTTARYVLADNWDQGDRWLGAAPDEDALLFFALRVHLTAGDPDDQFEVAGVIQQQSPLDAFMDALKADGANVQVLSSSDLVAADEPAKEG